MYISMHLFLLDTNNDDAIVTDTTASLPTIISNVPLQGNEYLCIDV